MSVVLDGTKRLWNDFIAYPKWIVAHNEEIRMHADDGDENAELICDIILNLALSQKARATLMVCVERYIHDWHPEIATIKGGYPKEGVSNVQQEG